jgi:hypothetical protein
MMLDIDRPETIFLFSMLFKNLSQLEEHMASLGSVILCVACYNIYAVYSQHTANQNAPWTFRGCALVRPWMAIFLAHPHIMGTKIICIVYAWQINSLRQDGCSPFCGLDKGAWVPSYTPRPEPESNLFERGTAPPTMGPRPS